MDKKVARTFLISIVRITCISICIIWCAVPYFAYAEGSKNLIASGGQRAYLLSTTVVSEYNPFPTRGTVKVYVNAGEKLYLGSSAQGLGSGTINVRAPNGDTYSSGVGTTVNGGVIANNIQENAGPAPFNANGYTPFIITAATSQSGVWEIDFVSPNVNRGPGDNMPGSINANASWNRTSNQSNNNAYITAFDVSVRNAANNAFIPGRAYMNIFAGSLGGANALFNATFKILTKDGYTYDVNNNGQAGYIFAFMVNNKGFRDASGNALYKSVNSSQSTALNMHDPRIADTETDITHKIFFNSPSSDLPASAPVYGGGTTWLLTTPASPVAANFSFTGVEGTLNQAGASPLGGYIKFETNQLGSYIVNLDINQNGSFTDAADRRLTGSAVSGMNSVYWDGKDGNGNNVLGALSFAPGQIKVTLVGGEVHFPFIDVENNVSGIVIRRTNGVGSPNDIVYWDDTPISATTYNGSSNPLKTPVDGVSSAVNGHKWGTTSYSMTAFGNERGLDTWAYVVSTPLSPLMNIQLQQADLEVQSVTSNKTSYCVGEPVTYTVRVRNNGPSAVTGARFTFDYPVELTVSGLSYTINTGTVAVSNVSNTGSQYTALLNMSNGGSLTLILTGIVSSYPGTELNTKAGIMRPADVTDPDATNPDSAVPADPQAECDAGPSGAGCNNIKSNSVTINTADISIAEASVAEGTGGISNILFPVSLSSASGCDITVDYAITDYGTTNAADFAGATSGTLTIPAGSTTANIAIPVATDRLVESNELFTITLSNASGGNQIIASTTTGTIINDDSGGITITPSGGAEGGTDAYFRFSLPSGITADRDIELDYVLSGAAIQADYTAPVTGTVLIPAGTNSVILPLGIIDDAIIEGGETVIMNISQVRSAYYTSGDITYNTPVPPELSITDNDTGILTLSGPVTVTEGNTGTTTTASFTVTLDKAAGDGFTVGYATTDGTARTSDLDYIANSGTLNFEGNANETHTITITVNGDNKIEAQELFNLAITSLNNNFSGRLTIVNPSTTCRIENDDSGQVGITAVDGEEGVSDVKFTFSFPPGISSGTPTVIDYTIDDTAADAALGSNVDYGIQSNGSVTIPAGTNSVVLVLPVVDDAVIESTETVKLTASISSGLPGIQLANAISNAVIKDNDYAALSIAPVSVSETNGNTTAIFNVTLNNPTGKPFDVNYTTSDGTATTADDDYIANSGILHFNGTASGENKTVSVTIKGDRKIEADEMFYVTLSNLGNTFDGRLTLPPPAAGTIVNDDSGAITITKADGSEAGQVAAKFIFSFPLGVICDQPVTVHYSFDPAASNAATQDADFTDSGGGELVIPAGQNNVILMLPVADDNIVEDTETITIASDAFISSVYPFITLNAARPAARITDNDTAMLTLTGPLTVTEGNSGNALATFYLTLDKALQHAVHIDYAVSDGTATIADNDYQDAHGTLAFSTANESKPITVYINGDSKIEADEVFNLVLGSLSDNFNGRLTVVNPAVTGTIVNDDSADIIITRQDGSEDGQPAQFIFSLKDGATVDAATTISYTLSGSALGGGIDYTGSPSGTITIPPEQNSAILSLPVTDDNKVEDTENIILTVNAVSSPYGLEVDAAGSETSLSLFDNDEATITISPATAFEGNSGITPLIFNVTLTKPVSHPFRLYYQTADGTATVADGDYAKPADGSYIDFTGTNPGTEVHSITIAVNGDRKIEGDEDFRVIIGPLTNDGTTDDTFAGRLTIPVNTITGVIRNDDSGMITITKSDGSEEGPAAGKFTFSFPSGITSDQPTTINYTLGGTATGGGVDYNPQYSGNITIPANTESISLNLDITDDEQVEGNETITLNSLSLGSARTGITLNTDAPAVTVTDNDVATLTLTGPPAITETNSGITTVSYTLKLDKAVPGGFNIKYATADGTATIADNDYNAATATLGFAGNANESQTITVTVNGDARIEPDETFKLILSDYPSMNGRLLVPVTELTTTILNDDQGTIIVTGTDGTEGIQDAAFRFSLPAGMTADRDIAINYTLTGAALSGTDYTVSGSSPLVLPAGENSILLKLMVTDDNIVEDTEQVNLVASVVNNPYGIVIDAGSPQQSLNIFDNDNAVLTISPVSLDEGNAGSAAATFTVTLSNPTTSPFKVHYKTADGTATVADGDYLPAEGDLDFSGTAGSLTRTIQVTVNGDRKIEANESFNVVLSLQNDGVHDYTFNNRLSINGSPAAGTILNDDAAQVTVTGTDGAEGGADPVFTFSLPPGMTADKPIIISYTMGGTATGGGTDYTPSDPGSVTIIQGQNSAALTLAVNDDPVIEDTETITLNDLLISSDYSITLNPVNTSVRIADNDAARLILSDPVSVQEGNSGTKLLTFRLKLDKATAAPFSIKYHTQDGTATTADNDYIASGIVQLDFDGYAGEEKEISIIVNGDTRIEANEYFDLLLTDLSTDFNGRLIIPSDRTRGYISNDDSDVITITKINGSEDGVNAAFSFSLPAGVTSDSDIIIDYILSGTAMAGTDYTASLPSPLILPAGQNSVTLTLNVNNDQQIEGTETVNIEANSRNNIHGITISNPIESLTIADNDTGKLFIGPAATDEGNTGNTTTITFNVTLEKATGHAFTIPYTTVNGTATSGDNDFVPVSSILSFSGNANETRTISVTVNGDNKIESDEIFNVVLGVLSNNGTTDDTFEGRLTIDNNTAAGTIRNDDSAAISISAENGSEAGPVPGKFRFSFPPGITSDKPVAITYILGGTAGSGIDYVPGSAGSIAIPANTNYIDLNLDVINDDIVENEETVTIANPELSTDYSSNITLSNAPLPQVIITDDDKAHLVLSAPVITNEENTGLKTVTYTLTLDNPVASGFSVNYGTSDNTAIADEDYIQASGMLSFNGQGNVSLPIEIKIKGDTQIEADETFDLNLDFIPATDTYGGRLSIPVKKIATTINNDDYGQIVITKNDGEEGAQDAAFIFSLTPGITVDQDILINYTLGGTAAAGDDYTGATTGTLTLKAGQNNVRLDLAVIDDNRVENAEPVSISAVVSSNPYDIALVSSSETLNIYDNDYAKISITGASQPEGNAGTSVMRFQVKLDKATGGPFTIGYSTADVTATNNDYVPVSLTDNALISFNGEANEIHDIDILINGDSRIERDETFRLILGALSETFGGHLTLENNSATGTIQNDDSGQVTVTAANGKEEGAVPGSFTFSLPEDMTSDEPVVINYRLDGTARPNGIDYTGVATGSITIPAGQREITLTLPVIDDHIVEGDETIIISNVSIGSSNPDITLGTALPGIIIEDNDQARISLEGPVSVEEGNAGTVKATFLVKLDKQIDGSFTLPYTTADGTATLTDNDYQSASGVLSFAGNAGEEHQVSVYVNGDTKIEADETFKLLLGGLSNDFGGRLTIDNTAAVCGIKNDDSGAITITKTDGSEGVRAASFMFSLPAGMTADANTVIHYTLSGTALANGADYSGALSGSVSIPAGATSAALILPVIDDEIAEDTETITLTSGVVESSYGITVSNSPQTLNILDNDRTELTIMPVTLQETDNGVTYAEFEVKLGKAAGRPFTIDYATADGTATTADHDYSMLTGTLSFNGTAGEVRTIRIPVNGDSKIEADEWFSVNLAGPSPDINGRLAIPVNTAKATIINDDSGQVSVTKIDGSEEGSLPAVFVFSFPEGKSSDQPVTINYMLGGTAIAGTDYTGSTPAKVILPAGQNSVRLELPVYDDELVEGDETITLAVTNITSVNPGITINPVIPSLAVADNDVATISIDGPVTVTEGNAGTVTALFTVKLDKAVAGNPAIDYATQDGTATASDNDYQPVTNSLQFSGVENETKTIPVLVNGDTKIENNEQFSVVLSNLRNTFNNQIVTTSRLTVSKPSATGIILDDDAGTGNKKIIITKVNGSEGGNGASFTFSFPAGITVDTDTEIFFTLGGTASSTDYSLATAQYSVTIPAGQNNITLDLPIIDDPVIEGAETIILTTGVVSNTRYSDITVTNSPQTVTIADNDSGVLTIGAVSRNEGDEGTGTLSFTIKLDKDTGKPFTIAYNTLNGSAAIEDGDYVPVSGILSFNGTAGETKTIDITINGDRKVEADETFYVQLSNLSQDFDGRLGVPVVPAAGTIKNDDSAAITVTKADGSEGGNPGRFIFSFPAGYSSDAETVINYTLGGTATAGADYEGLVSGAVTIPAGANNAILVLPVIDDGLIENDETIVINAGSPVSIYGNKITLNPGLPVVTITDNDNAVLSIDGPVHITEGDNGIRTAEFNVRLDNSTGKSFKVNYAVNDGTATMADNDYEAVSGSLTFAGNAGESHKISVSIKGDTKIEANEFFEVVLSGLSDSFNGHLSISGSPAQCIIEDDDNIAVNKQITISKTDGSEDGADAVFTFSFPSGVSSNAPTDIPYALGGTASGNGTDYTGAISGTVTIPAGKNSIQLVLPVNDDSITEGDESLVLASGQVSNNSYSGITVTNPTATLIIKDNDHASLIISNASMNEGNAGTGALAVKVRLNGATALPFTADYTTLDGTATVADNDYVSVAGKLSFNGTEGEERFINITVNGDRKIEADETLQVLLGELSTSFDGRLTVPAAAATGTIMNDDNGAISITGINGAEEGKVPGSFIFSFPAGMTSDAPTEIKYSLSGTATGGGTDYTAAVTGAVIIPAGAENTVLSLPVVDDDIVEDDESITISIPAAGINSPYNGNITVIAPLPEIKIADNDHAALILSAPLKLNEEHNGTTEFRYTLTLDNPTNAGFTLKYATADGTAKVSDNDYNEASGILSFSGTGGESKTISIRVNGDIKIEGDETFGLEISDLSNSFNSRLTIPAPNVTGTIINDDSSEIVVSKTDGAEGGQNGSFVFSFPAGVTSDQPTVINYRLSGTATASDYIASPSASVITIPAGESSVKLDINVADDAILEETETVVLTVTGVVNPYNKITAASPVPVLNIYDNDYVKLSISSPPPVIEHNQGTVPVTFTIKLDKATDRSFTVNYATADGTATAADKDYEAKSGKLTFAGYAGENYTVTVQVNGDLNIEGDETFSLKLFSPEPDFAGRLMIDQAGAATILNDDIPPVAAADFKTTNEDTPVTFSVAENDTDADGIDVSSITIVRYSAKGDVRANADGTVTYIPDLNEYGTDTFTYTIKDKTGLVSNEAEVTISIVPVNDPPAAGNDVFYVLKDSLIRADVAGNDSDPDLDVLRFRVTDFPKHGTLKSFDEADGTFIYIPDVNFTGADTLAYSACDPSGLCSSATVILNVQPRVRVSLFPLNSIITEGDSINITARLTEPLLEDVTVTLSYGGIAEKDKDYTLAGNYTTIMIPAGDTVATQKVTLNSIRDYLKEGDEVAELRIASATPSAFVITGEGSDIIIRDFYPAEKQTDENANADIRPDPMMSPNGDGLGNEVFVIYNIERYPDNEVHLYNRWGNEVYSVKGYNNKDKAFNGVANTGIFVNKKDGLTDGVYYYIIYTKTDKGDRMNKGYVIMKR